MSLTFREMLEIIYQQQNPISKEQYQETFNQAVTEFLEDWSTELDYSEQLELWIAIQNKKKQLEEGE